MITLKDLDRAYKVRTQIIECEETLASIKANAGLRSQALTGLPHSSTVSIRSVSTNQSPSSFVNY